MIPETRLYPSDYTNGGEVYFIQQENVTELGVYFSSYWLRESILIYSTDSTVAIFKITTKTK